jgi:hypothetical protein
MLGNLIRALADVLATHLVALTLIGFAIVGAGLLDLLAVPGISPTATATDTAQVERLEPSAEQEEVESPVVSSVDSAPAEESPSQPPMIGGTLPNYAAADSGFRPPVGAATTPHAPFQQSREEWVQRARKAFWNGNLEGAEAAYMDAIAEFPEDADLFGELGNLYESKGEDALALEAYFEAALRLRAAGELEKLSQIIELLESYGYSDAAGLRP